MNRKTFGPIGKCVYCGSTNELSDEHIIPESFGGPFVLAKSSCEVCRKITSDFERIVARNMFYPARKRMGLTKKRKNSPKEARVSIVSNGIEEDVKIPIPHYPLYYPIPAYKEPPGILRGRSKTEKPSMDITLKWELEEIKILKHHLRANSLTLTCSASPIEFSQMIAKIAHCSTMRLARSRKITTYLNDFILTGKGCYTHYLGRADYKYTDEKTIEKNNICTKAIERDGKLLTLVYINLSYFLSLPPYMAVTGEIEV